jgi:eukaryotic-like serine/threonine-protein kinase
MADETLVEAAGRIADGEHVDWGSISSTLKSDYERSVADELAVLSRIAAGHRQLHELLPVATDTPPNLIPDRARWGHLDLLNIVGRGSYGTVYRAWDTRLERLVALKLFHGAQDPDAVMQEGRMLARVRHENVVTVYGADVVDGVAGLWMELVHGRTLDQIVKDKGPMDPLEAAKIGADVSRALEAVHAAGLLHCDIKAQNVVREATGRVVLMDLGAGRLVPEARDSDQLSDVAGTPRYMAPELFHAGADATKSTDIYSFGVLLYYLVSARFPVDGKSLGELKQAHLEARVTPLKYARADVPAAYATVVSRALDRDPAKRPASVVDVQAGLSTVSEPPTRWTRRSIGVAAAAVLGVGLLAFTLLRQQTAPPATAPAPGIQSIAVLPIKNLTGDPSKQYVADGLTEVLISNLARIRSLRVPSFGAVSKFRDATDGDGAIAEQLGVQLLLAGSVAQADTKVRIAVRLVDQRGNAIWGEELTRESSALLSAQAEIARMVAARLALTVGPIEAAALDGQPGLKPEAADAYLRGLALRQSVPDRQTEAASLFRKTVEIEPGFAPAWADLAQAELYSYILEPNSADRARRANVINQLAERALKLDPQLAAGFVVRGTIQFYEYWDYPAAEQTFRQGLELAPNDGALKQRLSMLLAALGRLDEAIVLGRENRVYEPNDPFRATSLGMLYYYAHKFDAAEAEMKGALKLNPEFASAHYMLGRVYAEQGRTDQALSSMETALARVRYPRWLSDYARVLAAAGRRSDLESVLAELRERERKGEAPSPDQGAYIALAQGDKDLALAILEEGIRQHTINTLWLAVDPRVDPLRADPRFTQLLARMGLRP